MPLRNSYVWNLRSRRRRNFNRGNRRNFRCLVDNRRGRCRLLSVGRGRSPRRRYFGLCLRNSRRRFHLLLQLQQITPQSIADLHAQFCELEELLSKLVLPPEEEDSDEWSSDGKQREHYEYELHAWHSPVCT